MISSSSTILDKPASCTGYSVRSSERRFGCTVLEALAAVVAVQNYNSYGLECRPVNFHGTLIEIQWYSSFGDGDLVLEWSPESGFISSRSEIDERELDLTWSKLRGDLR